MTPGQLLDLNASSGISLRFYNSGSFKAGMQVADTSGQMIGTSVADDLAIRSQSNMLFSTGGNVERMRIDATGAVTMPAQPAFSVKPASAQLNIGTGSEVTVEFGLEIFDQNADFASDTFTAPVTGKYQFNLSLYTNNLDTAADYYILAIKTSNRTYENVIDPLFTSDPVYWSQVLCVLADMDANDTAHVFIQQGAGTAQTDITTKCLFSGYLVA